MPDRGILIPALDSRWRRFRKEWGRTRRKYSEDAVHDLRVASRRLLAVLDTLDSIVTDKKIHECRARIKKVLDALSPLRDTQVQRSYILKLIPRFPQLKDFDGNLEDKQKRFTKKTKKLLAQPPNLSRAIARGKQRA